VLLPTPAERLVDSQGRPYFLWDCSLTLEAWRALTRDDDLSVRAYWIGVAMRQAKPDDVLTLLTWTEIEEAWPALRLGREAAFWTWLRGKLRAA
jgi:hypothetical protein